MLVQICSSVYHSRFQGVIPPEPQGRAGVEGDHGDGCSHPGPPAYRILRPASQAQEESTPELEILKILSVDDIVHICRLNPPWPRR